MTYEAMRMECLKMALAHGYYGIDATNEAERLFKWIKDEVPAAAAPPVNFQAKVGSSLAGLSS